MSAIITQQFRKNNIQNVFNEMCFPAVTLIGCIGSSVTVIIPTSSTISLLSKLEVGMLVQATSAAAAHTLSSSGITTVTAISTNSFTIYPPTPVALTTTSLEFYSQYYIGIGKSDSFSGELDGRDESPGSPVAAPRTDVDVKNNLIALQRVSVARNTGSSAIYAIYGNAGYVLPRFNWISGSYIKAYDSTDPSCLYPSTITSVSGISTAYPCYTVHNSPFGGMRLYICAQSGMDASTSKAVSIPPNNSATVLGLVGSQTTCGYRWVYVGNLDLDTAGTLTSKNLTTASGNTSSTLDSNQFFKIYRRATTTGTSSVNTSSTFTNSAGGIYSCRIVGGGLGYTTTSTFVVDGDGSGASGKVTSTGSAGNILSVIMTAAGSSYTTGAVRFTSGQGTSLATILPRIAPLDGFGYDLTDNLPCWYAGFYGKFDYDSTYPGTMDVPAQDQIRQISLIRNPVVFTSSSGSAITFRCLKSLTISTGSGVGLPAVGDVIELTSTSAAGYRARGWIDHINTSANTSVVYYHQNSSRFGEAGESITPIPFSTGSGYAIWPKSTNYAAATTHSDRSITAVTTSEEYVGGTGQVMYVQNRIPMTQYPGQSEIFTIITQF